MKRLFALMLRSLGLLDFNFLVKRVARHPGKTEIPAGELWLVVDGGVKKWACLGCPGGCGVQISLSLNPERRPRWEVDQDFWQRPTVSPSIHQQRMCRCHFWIRSGLIEWCKTEVELPDAALQTAEAGFRTKQPIDSADPERQVSAATVTRR